MPNSIKKIVLYVLVILGIIYGYQFLTGKSIATLPGEIVNRIQQIGSEPQAESTNPRYYSDQEKRQLEKVK
nr:hypothetical protein [uncultured Desulfobulbus sp.]